MAKLPEERGVLSPCLVEAAVLDLLGTHVALTLTLQQAGRLNLRRDGNSLRALTGRHLAWPVSVLARLRRFLAQRCTGNEHWRGISATCVAC